MKTILLFPLLIGLSTGMATALPIQIEPPGTWAPGPAGSGASLGVYLSDTRGPESHGAVIEKVIPGSAAAEVGLKAKDRIQTWNGTRVESSFALVRMVRETPVGRSVNLGIVRENNRIKVAVTLRAGSRQPGSDTGKWFRPPPDRRAGPDPFPPVPAQPARPRLGIQLQELNPQLARFFGLESGQGGVLVASVFDGSAAEKSGLKAGDVIIAINGASVANADALTRSVLGAGDDITLSVLRDREKRTIEINPVAKKNPGSSKPIPEKKIKKKSTSAI